LAKREFYLRTAERDRPEPGRKADEHHHPKRGTTVQIHISVGMSSHKKEVKSYNEVIQKADRALYEAKAKGRNQVISTER
jgi:diguanylate cyclase (GGDEF)-like protein